MTSKYGVPLPLETYQGWPLRVGDFAAHGKREGLVAANDAVLVWSGGASDVTLQARPYRYVIERRIERAKSLLRARRRPSPRSPCCGFASQAHLNSAFKARTGVTPGVYRKR